MSRELLGDQEIQTRLAQLAGWQVEAGRLERTYQLASFAHAVLMIGAVAHLAEAADHHPDFMLQGYKRLTIRLVTHSAGGLTEKDFDLAQQIEALPRKQSK